MAQSSYSIEIATEVRYSPCRQPIGIALLVGGKQCIGDFVWLPAFIPTNAQN